jgi:GT2 family glycosyltransferase
MPEVGVVSTNMQMVFTDAAFDLRGPVPEHAGSFRLTRMGYAQYETSNPQTELVPMHFVSGNGLAFRKSLLKDIGNYLFDCRLGSYAEDLDFSIRVNRSPWKMYMNPQAVIFHYRDDSFSGSPQKALKKFSHISSNRLLVYFKHLFPGRFLAKMPLLVAGIPLKVGRLDGENRFDWLRFSAGFLTIPFVLLVFVKKALSFKNMKSGIDSEE